MLNRDTAGLEKFAQDINNDIKSALGITAEHEKLLEDMRQRANFPTHFDKTLSNDTDDSGGVNIETPVIEVYTFRHLKGNFTIEAPATGSWSINCKDLISGKVIINNGNVVEGQTIPFDFWTEGSWYTTDSKVQFQITAKWSGQTKTNLSVHIIGDASLTMMNN